MHPEERRKLNEGEEFSKQKKETLLNILEGIENYKPVVHTGQMDKKTLEYVVKKMNEFDKHTKVDATAYIPEEGNGIKLTYDDDGKVSNIGVQNINQSLTDSHEINKKAFNAGVKEGSKSTRKHFTKRINRLHTKHHKEIKKLREEIEQLRRVAEPRIKKFKGFKINKR